MGVMISSLADYRDVQALPRPRRDALRDRDALVDAHLVAIWLGVAASTATLLLDLRQAKIGDAGNTAVLIVRGTRSVSWDGQPWLPGWLAWVVGTSIPQWTDDLFRMELEFEHPSPSGRWPRCLVAGEGARYYIGDVPDLPEVPPDFGTDSERMIREGMIGWDSAFVPHAMSIIP